MARRTTLLELLTMLRSELGRSDNPAVGVSDVPRLRYELNKAYESVRDRKRWPHLYKIFDKIDLQAGEQFYDFPSDLDYNVVEGVFVWWNGRPYEIKRGISVEDFNSYDSTSDERANTVQKWDVRDTGTREQVVVWPIPSDNEQDLQFVGWKKFSRLVNNADRCEVDDLLVVLLAAAAIDKDRAKEKMAMFQDRWDTLAANAASGERDIRLNLEPADRDPVAGVTIRVS